MDRILQCFILLIFAGSPIFAPATWGQAADHDASIRGIQASNLAEWPVGVHQTIAISSGLEGRFHELPPNTQVLLALSVVVNGLQPDDQQTSPDWDCNLSNALLLCYWTTPNALDSNASFPILTVRYQVSGRARQEEICAIVEVQHFVDANSANNESCVSISVYDPQRMRPIINPDIITQLIRPDRTMPPIEPPTEVSIGRPQRPTVELSNVPRPNVISELVDTNEIDVERIIDEFECSPGTQRLELRRGVNDGFSDDGGETGRLRSAVGSLTGWSAGQFDQKEYDAFIVDYFDVPTDIVSGVFVTFMRHYSGSRDFFGLNDTIGIGDATTRSLPSTQRPIFQEQIDELTWAGQGTPQHGQVFVQNFDLIHLRNGNSLLEHIQSSGGLTTPVDVWVEDDTSVDFFTIVVCLN